MTEIIQPKYSIILSDPAWQYNDRTPRGGAENHYPTMSTEDLCALPVGQLAADDCAMFMWGTYPKLPDMLQVMAAWGFEYKTLAFQWVKTYKSGKPFWGMGRWTRANTEGCFLGIKGKPKRLSAGVHQVIMSPIRKHSEKPPETRDFIKKLLGEDLPAVELFARTRVPGWMSWGNQIESDPLVKGILG